ncbi:Protoporphyrinogen oxidase 1, chloroplastic [Morella rubra]|uniref:Protoporphyrinogen oxidase n=1 Tax=Morella rubra TaxID=262757 RepID=A0A6A1WFU2_9ROSI|nr:Protoporphyrinogen oxidase 1, chloroplastic [Morella rubra]
MQDVAAAADTLSKFYYPPVAAVSISYPKEAIRTECLVNGELKGFGQLHPRSQGVETLGTIYSSALFPHRAPAGRVLLLNYIGGATNPGILSKTESELVEAVDRDLRKILIKPSAKDPLALGVRVWPQAIPQFLIGHFDLLDAAKASLSDSGFQGLFLGGNYVSGVALGRCVEGAYEVAAEVTDFLSQYAPKG